MTQQEHLVAALHATQSALDLIASPARPDGTYNRDRRACELLARETLDKVRDLLAPPAPLDDTTAAPAASGSGPFVVSTDGASKGNPGPSGWGVVLLEAGVVKFAGGGFIGSQTNQVAELVAAIEGLSRVPEGAQVELQSDSQYTLKGLTEWRAGWERNGWRNSTGGPVANKEYWQRLFALADKRKVTTRKVKGHSGDPLNERADALANKGVASRAALVLE